ncbi:sugar ABC transporter permease [Salinibacterium sp. dk2585]|uniref:carbohydrate ABC transporter permease n=1 Tax=unclassified Salinibacterium TaxID=2632331 RepID=UPI0011C2447F|nr:MULTISPECIES: sugar ABC transporter permease [unclassified Salinibacterium]QEE60709.1 sugar ABC transporter permease [Salinibacterium sp. dk2585]TXK55781.1 sugar ABC transporter permease [Salinibacterium sp. dk5596]
MTVTQAAPPPVASDTGPTNTQTRAPRRRPGGSNGRKWLEIAIFAGPALLVFISFVIVPVALAAVYSLYNWNGLGPLDRFIGLDNYVRAFSDPLFVKAIGNNATIVVASILVQGPLAIAVALLLNRRMRGRGLIRALIFVPYVLAEVIAGLSWKLLLSPRGGVNAVLEGIGLGHLAKPWLADPDTALWVMFGILTWKYLGFAILLMLAGLQGVPEELQEAAAIDGASWWQTQWRITLPLLGPTIRIWIFLSMIGSLQLFDMVWVTTKGGPIGATNTMAVYMIQYGQGQYGYGSAIAVILFVISLIVALVYQRFAMRRDLAGAITSGVR